MAKAKAKKKPAAKKPAKAKKPSPKKAAPKKPAPKKPAPKKAAPKKAAPNKRPAAKKPGKGAGTVADALARLRAWAGTDTSKLEGGPPGRDTGSRLDAPQPMWGHITWALPPSYAELLAEHGWLAIRWGDPEWPKSFVVLTPAEIGETSGIVYMPSDVSRDPGKYLSTNHLVPFASAGNDECAFCFDVTQPDAHGEYPVYFHHQDEPRARYLDGGAWEDPGNETPDFPSFAAWLAWVADEVAAGRDPASSSPTAFYDMPGRAS